MILQVSPVVQSNASGSVDSVTPLLVGSRDTCTAQQSSDDYRIRGEVLLDVLCNNHFIHETDLPAMLSVIIDSGASTHMLPLSRLCYDISAVDGVVSLGDNTKQISIVGIGLTTIEVLIPVLIVPELSCGLISIPTLDKAGFNTTMHDGKCTINFCGETVLTGTLTRGLYYLDEPYVNILHELDGYAVKSHLVRPRLDTYWWQSILDDEQLTESDSMVQIYLL